MNRGARALAALSSALRPGLAVPLLVAITLAAWGAVPLGTFNFDDYQNVVLDTATTGQTAIGERLLTGVRPLLRLSYVFDFHVWGMTAAGFLATNLALHVAMVLGVYVLARRRLVTGFGALVAAAVFAMQPAHAEVVAYVSGRSTGLMAVLLVWALALHDMARDRFGRSRLAWRAASLLLFVAACFAKEVALVFPALLALWEWTRSDERSLRRDLLAPALAASVVALTLLAVPLYRDLAAFSLALRPPLDSLVTNIQAVPVMLSLWVRPWALSVDHGFDPAGASSVLGADIALLSALVAVAFACRRRAPVVTLAIGWALLALAPTNSLIAKLDPVTEKPLYLAWIGPSLAIGAAIAAAATASASQSVSRVRAAIVRTAVVALLVAGGLATTQRIHDWSDARLLWRDAVAKAPGNSRAWNNLGMAYFTYDQDREAIAAFDRAIALDPGNGYARRNRNMVGFLAGGNPDPGLELTQEWGN